MERYKVFIITLGCPKNTVDSQNMMHLLEEKGFTLAEDSVSADVIIINTCGFIMDAKEESISYILDAVEIKKERPKVKIVVTGCLSQGYHKELIEEIPEVDLFLGTMDMFQIADRLEEMEKDKLEKKVYVDNKDADIVEMGRFDDMESFSYVKLGEGCNKKCTYCIIPSLRGIQRDRRMEDIISEVELLVSQGKKEIILISQDTGEYGRALYGQRMLAELLRRIDRIEGIKWIRLLYVYPETVSDELIDVMKNSKHVLHYIDIPLQHISDSVLKRMARATTKASIEKLITKLRLAMPDIVIRSSFIAGFPGETKEDMYELAEFFKEYKLTRVGVFCYSQEEGTPAAAMEDQVDENVKDSRRNYLMEIQADISQEIMDSQIGNELEVVIEDYEGSEDGLDIYSARSYMDAPEIDGCVYVYTDKELQVGDYITCKITDSLNYDLFGEY